MQDPVIQDILQGL